MGMAALSTEPASPDIANDSIEEQWRVWRAYFTAMNIQAIRHHTEGFAVVSAAVELGREPYVRPWRTGVLVQEKDAPQGQEPRQLRLYPDVLEKSRSQEIVYEMHLGVLLNVRSSAATIRKRVLEGIAQRQSSWIPKIFSRKHRRLEKIRADAERLLQESLEVEISMGQELCAGAAGLCPPPSLATTARRIDKLEADRAALEQECAATVDQ